MPYKVFEESGKHCVHKLNEDGSKGDLVPGGCHGTPGEAADHAKALYVNVEDADKGGPGSGWHAPAEGTHTAANAPNFAGGPGADRVYGKEDEKPPKSKRCKCSKCGAEKLLPKGQQCEDVKCPSCGTGMAQTEPREDKPAGGEEGRAPSAGRKKAVHGEGSMLGEVTAVVGEGDGDTCKCPHCGKPLPCTAKACPHCKEKIDRVERGEGERVVEDEEKRTTKSEGPDTPDGEKSAWTVYKSADGTWRWLALCNWAVVDREAEVVSEKAYQDAIVQAQKSGRWGELDLVHVNGTDVGDCDTMFITKGDEPGKFGAGGPWYGTPLATGAREAVQANPDYWGMSVKFRYNPSRKVRGVYAGDIEFLKYTILPQAMAASYGTAIAVEGGQAVKELSDDQRKALADLNLTEEQIAEFAQKQKALPPEENVVEKDEQTPEEEVKEADAPVTRKQFWTWLKEMFTATAPEETPVASTPEEAGKADEVTEPAKAAQPAETKQAGGEPEGDDAANMLHAFGAEMAKSLGELVQKELATRDGRIAALEEEIKALHTSVEDKVNERLRDVPPVVTVAASQVQATVSDRQPQGLTFGQRPEVAEQYTEKFLESIERLVDKRVKGAKYQA